MTSKLTGEGDADAAAAVPKNSLAFPPINNDFWP